MPDVDLYLRGFTAHPFEAPAEGLQRVLGISHGAAAQLIDSLPQYIKVGLTQGDGQSWAAKLKSFGGQVELHPHAPGRAVATLPQRRPTPVPPAGPVVHGSSAPTVSMSTPGASSGPKQWTTPQTPHIPRTAPPPADLQAMLSSDRIVASAAPSPPAADSRDRDSTRPPNSDPPISPSGRIMGSVRPPTIVSSPSSRPPPAMHEPTRPSDVPPSFEDAITSRPPASQAPAPLWAPKPAYKSMPPPEPFTIRFPVRYVGIAVGVATLIWIAYRLGGG